MGITRVSNRGKNVCFVHTLGPLWCVQHDEMPKIAWYINLPSEKQKLCSKTFAQAVFSILQYSPVDEKKFSPSSILCPPPFKENVPRPRSLKIENEKKEVRQPLLHGQ